MSRGKACVAQAVQRPVVTLVNNVISGNPAKQGAGIFLDSGFPCVTLSKPLIDQGNNAAQELPVTDQDEQPRIVGVAVDLEAYESQ